MAKRALAVLEKGNAGAMGQSGPHQLSCGEKEKWREGKVVNEVWLV